MSYQKLYYSLINVNPLDKKNLNHPPPPPPHLYPNHHAPDVFLSFQFPLVFTLKKADNAQLCSGIIEAINSTNIENRP